MRSNLVNRDHIIQELTRELVGPSPDGTELVTTTFSKPEDAYGPFVEKGTGEEILQRDIPLKRYGVAVLHPVGDVDEGEPKSFDAMGMGSIESNHPIGDFQENALEEINKKADSLREKLSRITTDSNLDDLDLSTANTFKPSSLGISFLAEFPPGSLLEVSASGGRYRSLEVEIGIQKKTWWVRSSVTLQVIFSAEDIELAHRKKINPSGEPTSKNLEGMNLQVEVFARPYSKDSAKLLTVCLINRTHDTSIENILFQAHFKLSVVSPDGQKHILPYPGPELSHLDEEEKSMELLYRHEHTFGIGHGCAAMWNYKACEEKTSWLSAECLPYVETPSITPDIRDENNIEIRIPMAPLAGLVDGDDGFGLLEKLIESYEKWISERDIETARLESEVLKLTAQNHIKNCRLCASRMRQGLSFLKSNPKAYRAFQLANLAVLLQQIHSTGGLRPLSWDTKSKRLLFSEPYVKPDPKTAGSKRGFWRAFQIAFLLNTVESTADPDSTYREAVELIWFPTGGGKTEAYLGLSAFALFFRRLSDNEDNGVHVLMRYTLRLLTTQQFLRASRLICALEDIRRANLSELGEKEFSIGLWVGAANTPNSRDEALSVYKGLEKGDKYTINKFILDRCPWCGAQIGPLSEETSKKSKSFLVGYARAGNTVYFKCSDRTCEFSSRLPIYVTDEEMYENPPSMVIGTVDKFAMLAWKPQARIFFGIDGAGKRFKSPPGLIIQDELHLISGPLGSMVGLFEALIEELCTDKRTVKLIRPKIISSTATIRRFQEQIKSLYARDSAFLFPPAGIEAGNSFFSKYAELPDRSLAPGRIYLGVHAPGLGSMQTMAVRTFTTLLQAPMDFPESERDPWWTLMLFYNNLRELGAALSLMQSDIPDYQQGYLNRQSKIRKNWRNFSEIIELTGRISSEEVPQSITNLEKPYPGQNQQRPIDVCLASNILEVGVDIERLSLMVVNGQPKTTSQYIQVTGRVGRNWVEKPGLIVTLYSATRPRDRSHFEKFVSYHQKLYAQVEPTSVTPFSAPALDRALHAIMIGYVLQNGDEREIQRPDPFPEKLINELRGLVLRRIQFVDPDEVDVFNQIFDRKVKQWKKSRPILWSGESGNMDDVPLMKAAGSFSEHSENFLPWSVMQSMRSVDAECLAEIYHPLTEGDAENA